MKKTLYFANETESGMFTKIMGLLKERKFEEAEKFLEETPIPKYVAEMINKEVGAEILKVT